jgi:cellulose synthase operon protein B
MALTTDVSQLARGSAILIGSPTEGVSALAARFEIDLKAMREAWARPPADKDSDAAKASNGGDENFEQWANEAQPVHPALDWPARLHAIYDRYINVHFRDFAALRKGDALFSPPPAATLLLAQAAAPAGGGAWTIMLAPDDDALVRGVRSLVATNVWNRVEGRAAALDPKTGALKTSPTGSPYFIPTATLSPANFRLIAAGWLSNDADVYTGLALFAALALGAASYSTVRRYGARQ